MTDLDTGHEATTPRVAQPATPRSIAVVLVVAGALGLLAAATLLTEKLALLADPEYVPTCSINPVVSCGSVMTSWQAEVLGVPNPLVGVAAFSVVLTTGVALLAGTRLARWYWWGLLGGATLGTVFVHWLIYQSMFEIGALCPYCMVVWVVTVTLLVTVARHSLRLHPRTTSIADAIDTTHVVIITGWVLAVAGLALAVFWDSWITMLR